MRKNLIIVGNQIKPDWEFRKGLEDGSNEPWINRSCTTNRFNGINKFTRYIKYFTISFSVILNRKKYKTIVTWDQFFGLILAFYARLFRLKDLPHIYPMAFIYRPKKGFVGKIYRRFVEYAITSGKITNVILFSDSEAQYYAELFGVDESLFIPETLGVEDRSKEFAQTEKPDTYVAAGRSNRDYDFLRDSWREMDKHLDIICDTENRPNTNNISHLTDCHGDKYLQKIADARVVIVPLSDEKVSSGQLVFEHAAMFGKPVIVTRNKTLNRYIEDDITGLIIEKDYSAEEIMFLMYRAQILFVAATLLFLIINPGLSFNHQNNNELSFVGLFTVKNSAGFECCNGLMSQMGLYLVKKEKKESVSTRFVALIAVELVLLIISRAMGALLAAVLACGYVFFWYVFQHARKRLPIGFLYTVISVGFLFSALSILDLLTPFLLGIGKDPTLTGRTKIWEGVINLMQKSHTMTGFGFSMFWRDESAYSMLHSLFRKDSWYSTMMYGTHNAVLELWVDVGLIGLALYFLAILYCFRNTKKASKAQYVLIVSYMIIFTLEGLTERAYTVSNFKTLFLFILLGVGCHCGDFITAKNTNEQSQMISSSAQVAA